MTEEELKERGKIKVLPHKGAQEIPDRTLQDKLQGIKPVQEGKAIPEIKRQLVWKLWDLIKVALSGVKDISQVITGLPKGADLIMYIILLALIALIAYLTKGAI